MEVTIRSQAVPILDSSSVGEARRTAARVCSELGADETQAGTIGIIATEIARNVSSHAGGGQVIVSGARDSAGGYVELLSLDSGPGIKDVMKALSDGFSTGSTPGTGLGAIKRMASELDVYTSPKGTIVFARLQLNGNGAFGAGLYGMAIPVAGETVSGDAWAYAGDPDRQLILLVDGLGHGIDAAAAAQEAVLAFRANAQRELPYILACIHDNLKKTRGGVAAIAEIRKSAGSLCYAGVGNISATVFSNNASRSLVSLSGTLGSVFPKARAFESEWTSSSCLVMHSDGLQSRWDLSAYSGLMSRKPATIAGVLIRDYRRQRDDCSVVVFKAGRDGA